MFGAWLDYWRLLIIPDHDTGDKIFTQHLNRIVRHKEAIVPQLLKLLNEFSYKHLSLYDVAAAALGQIGDRRAIPALLSLLENRYVKFFARDALNTFVEDTEVAQAIKKFDDAVQLERSNLICYVTYLRCCEFSRGKKTHHICSVIGHILSPSISYGMNFNLSDVWIVSWKNEIESVTIGCRSHSSLGQCIDRGTIDRPEWRWQFIPPAILGASDGYSQEQIDSYKNSYA